MAVSLFQTALLFLTTTIFTTFVAGAALKNITLTVPDGATNHGNPNLLCTPTTASDIIIFYLGNYVAHAATVVTLPGEKDKGVLVTIILSLLFPLSGIMRGLDAIAYHARHGKNDLKKAARAGALCMVIRSNEWKPVDGDKLPVGLLSINTDNSEIETGILISFHRHMHFLMHYRSIRGFYIPSRCQYRFYCEGSYYSWLMQTTRRLRASLCTSRRLVFRKHRAIIVTLRL